MFATVKTNNFHEYQEISIPSKYKSSFQHGKKLDRRGCKMYMKYGH